MVALAAHSLRLRCTSLSKLVLAFEAFVRTAAEADPADTKHTFDEQHRSSRRKRKWMSEV